MIIGSQLVLKTSVQKWIQGSSPWLSAIDYDSVSARIKTAESRAIS